MSNFPSYMALGASAATYSRVANLEYAVTQLTDALINELAAIGETLTDSLAVQQELLNREVFQSNIEEFIYQLEKSVQEAEYSKSGESPVTYFFRLSYFLHTVDQEQINTSIIKGRENKAAFDRAVSTALKLCNSLRTNGEVIAAIDQIELEESRRRVLREEELRRKKRARKIAIVLITSFLLIYPIYLLLESPRMRAYLGSVTAQKTLAQKYYDGQGVVRDYQESLKWFQKAADQGDKDAQYELGKWYYSGEWVTRDYAEALKWFQKAAEQGNVESLRQTNLLSSFLTTKEKAEQGDKESQYQLGLMYYKGEGISKDLREAFTWLQKAASQDHAAAQTYLGAIYFGGEGVLKDYTEAFKWFQKAAEQGVAEAQYNMGLVYYSGLGVSQDYSKALKWFKKAAEQGHTEAQHNMGAMYYNGYGVSKDRNKAVSWLCKAAAQGYQDSIKNLKEMGETCGR